jgi:hypothetical protein
VARVLPHKFGEEPEWDWLVWSKVSRFFGPCKPLSEVLMTI